MKIRDAASPAAALVLAGALGTGIIALIASGEPVPAPAPEAVVTTTQEPEHMAPRCFETSVNGTQDCAWVPVAACLTDETGDDAIPSSFEGCYWDAESRGNHTGTSYVIWRQNRG
nr:MAG TPA: hypothetical protein [Caudoviricetes sp.]